MLYINKTTLEIISIQDIIRTFPNISFGSAGPDAEFLVEHQYAPYNPFGGNIPAYDVNTQELVPHGTDETETGFVPLYVVRELLPDEIAARLESKWANVRAVRDMLIQQVMWLVERYNTQLFISAETTNTAEEIRDVCVYIQALRDITTLESPDDIVWPANPTAPVSPTEPALNPGE